MQPVEVRRLLANSEHTGVAGIKVWRRFGPALVCRLILSPSMARAVSRGISVLRSGSWSCGDACKRKYPPKFARVWPYPLLVAKAVSSLN